MKEKLSKDLVAVVIPIYKKELCELELRSLKQAYELLKAYPLILVKPESLDLSEINNQFPLLTIISFDDLFFSSIKGYNQLMLSSLFYERFLQYQYILIYQLDAYVFRDELAEWCLKGYDYIGAPWLKKKIYEYPLISTFTKYLHQKKRKSGEISKYDLYNKIGNGGFSLRKVDSHFHATKRYKEKIDTYIAHKQNHLYNEDVFFATEVSEFLYPNSLEALYFSFDKYPFFSYQLTKKQLPFGCHGWYKRKMKKFWKPIIGF
jgi:hypothetical protein